MVPCICCTWAAINRVLVFCIGKDLVNQTGEGAALRVACWAATIPAVQELVAAGRLLLSWWMHLAFQPRRCQVCSSRQARRCKVQQAALHKQTHRNCRRFPHGRYSFSPTRFDLRKDFKSLSLEALCSRQALTSCVWTAHLGRPTVGATRNKWRNRNAPGVRHHSSSFGSSSNDAGMYKACAEHNVNAMAPPLH